MPAPPGEAPVPSPPPAPQGAPRGRASTRRERRNWSGRWEVLGFVAAVLVFALTRFWRLGEYPIYFFTDEAYLPVLAEQPWGAACGARRASCSRCTSR